jgi:hypothetical protein
MTAMTMNNQRITLLNASYEVLNSNLSMQKAARLLSLGKAIVEEADASGRFLRDWAWPRVLRLTYHVKVAYNRIYGPPRVSKRGVLVRDKHICAFDNCKNYAATIDHVLPRSRGGKNNWENLVAACTHCNHKKRNRTPEEAGMVLKWKGYVPTKAQLYA